MWASTCPLPTSTDRSTHAMASTMPVPEALEKLNMYIDGEFVEPASGEYFESFDPYTARPWALVGARQRRGRRPRRPGRAPGVPIPAMARHASVAARRAHAPPRGPCGRERAAARGAGGARQRQAARRDGGAASLRPEPSITTTPGLRTRSRAPSSTPTSRPSLSPGMSHSGCASGSSRGILR